MSEYAKDAKTVMSLVESIIKGEKVQCLPGISDASPYIKACRETFEYMHNDKKPSPSDVIEFFCGFDENGHMHYIIKHIRSRLKRLDINGIPDIWHDISQNIDKESTKDETENKSQGFTPMDNQWLMNVLLKEKKASVKNLLLYILRYTAGWHVKEVELTIDELVNGKMNKVTGKRIDGGAEICEKSIHNARNDAKAKGYINVREEGSRTFYSLVGCQTYIPKRNG